MIRSVRLRSSLAFLLSLSATAAAAEPIGGRVVDPAGRPVPRALVRAVDASGRTIAEVFSAADGTFRLDLTTSTCTLQSQDAPSPTGPSRR